MIVHVHTTDCHFIFFMLMETPKMVAFVVKRYGTHYARPKNGGTQYAVRKDKKRRYAVRKGGRGVTLMYLFSK